MSARGARGGRRQGSRVLKGTGARPPPADQARALAIRRMEQWRLVLVEGGGPRQDNEEALEELARAA